MTPRVFMVEEYKVDARNAERFGTLVYIFQPNEYRPSIWDEAFRDAAIARLDKMDYDPTVDYIIVAGAIVPLTLVLTELVATFGEIQVLFYSASEREYTAKTVGFLPCSEDTTESVQC